MANKGIRSRFSDRIKKIASFKNKRQPKKIEDSDVTYRNFLKVVAAIPLLVSDNLNSNHIDKSSVDQKESNAEKKKKNSRENKRKLIDQIDVSLVKKKQDVYGKNIINKGVNKNKETNITDIEEAKNLEKKIINLIKKNLIKTVNELEIIQSELYLINEVNGDDKKLKECQATLDEVKKMLCKIDILKKKYDFLKDNYDFEYLLELDDEHLVDSIIELKNKFSNVEVKATVTDYKLLDVYKFLYLRIDKLQDEVSEFEKYKEEELQKLKERDIDFEKLKNDVYNVSRVNDGYNKFVDKQNDLLDELNKKVDKIDSHEDVSYNLKGFNRLLFNSFKYLGLLMMSPLKGIIPSIATETLITKNVVSNLFNNLEWEEKKKTIYTAIDYSNIIGGAINDLENTGRIVDTTLEDIVNLKIKYNENFRMYQGDFLEYEQVISKINDMENKILGNKIKIEMMRKRMLDKERVNYKKLQLVRELNDKKQ